MLHIHQAIEDELSHVRIQLHPKELGRVEVRLELGDGGRLSAHVLVQRAETLELMMRDARGLERALQDAGFDLDSDSLAFDLLDRDFGDGHDDRGAGDIAAGPPDPLRAMAEAEIGAGPGALLIGPGAAGIDIRV